MVNGIVSGVGIGTITTTVLNLVGIGYGASILVGRIFYMNLSKEIHIYQYSGGCLLNWHTYNYNGGVWLWRIGFLDSRKMFLGKGHEVAKEVIRNFRVGRF